MKDYDIYQLNWMLRNNHSLDEMIEGMQQVFENLYKKKEGNEIIDIKKTYDAWLDSYGFNKKIFMSLNEFKKGNNELICKFKEHCENMAYYYHQCVEKDMEGKYVIYSNEPIFKELEMYEYGSEWFEEVYPLLLRDCKTLDDCIERLKDTYTSDLTDFKFKSTKDDLDINVDAPIVALRSVSYNQNEMKYWKVSNVLSNNLQDILQFEEGCHEGTWFVDMKTKNLCSVQHRLKDTHYVEYYKCNDIEKFEDAFVSFKDFKPYLEPIGNEVLKKYGVGLN